MLRLSPSVFNPNEVPKRESASVDSSRPRLRRAVCLKIVWDQVKQGVNGLCFHGRKEKTLSMKENLVTVYLYALFSCKPIIHFAGGSAALRVEELNQ